MKKLLIVIFSLSLGMNLVAQFSTDFKVVADGKPGDAYGDLVNIDIVDLNKDSYSDILMTYTDRIVWMRNDGVENFHNDSTVLNIDIPDIEGFFNPVFKDLDNDGLDDLSAGRVWRKRLTTGEFSPQEVILSDPMAAMADFDNDGLPDALTLDDSGIYLQKNLGNGNFGIKDLISSGAESLIFAAADLNNDGHVDFISKESSGCFFYKNPGNAAFEKELLFSENPELLIADDFNNDGETDLITAENSGNIVCYNFDSDAGLEQNQHISDDYSGGGMALGDINEDGLKDLVVGSIGGSGNYFSYSSSTESFASVPQIPTPTNFSSFGLLEIGDLNNDGLNDILTGNVGLYGPSWLKQTTVPGVFARFKQLFIVFGLPTVIRSADLEGDGDPDIFMDGSWLVENLGAGTYARKRPFRGLGGRGFRADFDGDGLEDLATPRNNEIVWRRNLGNDILGDPILIPGIVYGCREVSGGDLDMDGDIDLFAAVGVETIDPNSRFYWFENDGNGNFTEHLIETGIQQVLGIVALDVNGDGLIDPVLTLSNLQPTIWYPNLGTGAFGPPQQLFPAGTPQPSRVLQRSIKDLNQDGLPDLIFAQRSLTGRPKVVWYRNLGNGSFSSQITLWTTVWAGLMDCYFTIYDADSNGSLDLVIADWYWNRLIFLKAIAPGEFAPELIIHDVDGEGDYYGLEPHDYDGDGKLDLLFGRRNPETRIHELCVLQNTSLDIPEIKLNEETVICHSNLTSDDPFDDLIGISVNVDGSGLSDRFVVEFLTENLPNDTFFYNERKTLFFSNGSAGSGDQELLIYDLADNTISKTIFINDPGFCSPESQPSIKLKLNEQTCYDNGTPFDATDDLWTVIFEVSGYSVSNQCVIFSPTRSFRRDTIFYNQPYIVEFGEGASGGGAKFVFAEDFVEPNITDRIFIADIESCSENAPAAISIRKLNVECDDNGTSKDASDDKLLITQQFSIYNEPIKSAFFLFNSNLGDLNLTGQTVWTNYGAYDYTGTYELPAGSAGITPIELRIFDSLDFNINLDTIIANPGVCSDVSYIEEVFNNQGLKVYPNPFFNQFQIEFYSKKSSFQSLEITDLLGKRLLKKEFFAVEGKNNIQVDGSDFPTGILTVKLISDKKSEGHFEMLKLRK